MTFTRPVAANRNDPLRCKTGRLTGVRILLVEDHPDTRDVIVAMLSQHGADVFPVVTAQEALDYLNGDHADVIVCDIHLPGVPGHNLARSLRNLPPERGGTTPAIALTGFASADDEAVALDSGFSGYLRKPAGSELVDAIIQAVQRSTSPEGAQR